MPLVIGLESLTPDRLPEVGGKAINLGWMAVAGLPVPPGFCVTTDAFRRFLGGHPDPDSLFAALQALDPGDVEGVRTVAGKVRDELERLALPDDVVAAVLGAWRALDGPSHAWAVRSSATAEDLPGSSFAGQHDTVLNVRGQGGELLRAVRRCFGSLFTDRAVLYRARNGFRHRDVALAVVVQRMVAPEVSGILFTADPVSGDRTTASIDAGYGLGEGLVSGRVDGDLYRVDKATGGAREVRIGEKALAIRPVPDGGTTEVAVPEELRKQRVLTDGQLAELVAVGRRIEDAAGSPQDIEWAYEDGALQVLQARPITSLYPAPTPPDDGLHLYFSFGHAQMMSDAMPPLARDTWVHLMPFGRGSLTGRAEDISPHNRAFVELGGRMYIDVTAPLRIPPLRRLLLAMLGTVYPQIPEVLGPKLARLGPDRHPRPSVPLLRIFGPLPLRVAWTVLFTPVSRFATRMEHGIARVLEASALGPSDRPRQARDRLGTLFPSIPRVGPPFVSGLIAQKLLGRLGISLETLQPVLRALPGNVTTEMDLELADLAVRVRSRPDDLASDPEFAAFVERYGMRGPGEIDLSRPRWRDQPGMLINAIRGSASGAGDHRRRHAELAREAEAAAERIAMSMPRWKRPFVRRLLRVMRAGLGLREHPKSLLVRVFDGARQIAVAAGRRLSDAGVVERPDDVWFLRWDELIAADEGRRTDLRSAVSERRRAFDTDRKRSPPLAITSEGERLDPRARADLPPGAIGGIGASAGVVEGVARVVLDPATEVLHAGEVLVAPSTDPGWTPLFTHAAALVTEIGGLLTHGSVVAREMGIPAVVGATGATTKIRTGDRVRVDGDQGWVAVLPD